MLALWTELIPIILISSALPAQTVVTLVIARSSLMSAYAWVTGMIVARLLQGVLFGFVPAPRESDLDSGPQFILGAMLLVLSLLLYVKALRTAFGAEDEDAPPPKWIAKASSISPLAAFGAGAGFMTLSAKYLVFTLAAISSIMYAQVGVTPSVLTFFLFVALSHVAPFGVLALSASSSDRSVKILNLTRRWLHINNRMITIIFAMLFGSWFLIKAFVRLHII